jgi:hypothetical protein
MPIRRLIPLAALAADLFGAGVEPATAQMRYEPGAPWYGLTPPQGISLPPALAVLDDPGSVRVRLFLDASLRCIAPFTRSPGAR